jgi:hypothetical protein
MKWRLYYLHFPAHIEHRSQGKLYNNHAAAATLWHVMRSDLCYCCCVVTLYRPVLLLLSSPSTEPASRYTALLSCYTQKHKKYNFILGNWSQPCINGQKFCVYLCLSTSRVQSHLRLFIIQFPLTSYPFLPFKYRNSHQQPLCLLSLNILKLFSALNVTEPSSTPTQIKHAEQ